MDTYFKNTQYPLVSFLGKNTALNDAQADLLKSTLIDFKLVVYSNRLAEPPLVYLDEIVLDSGFTVLFLNIRAKFVGAAEYINAGRIILGFNLNDAMFDNEANIRAHFNADDIVPQSLDSRISSIDGHISFKDLRSWQSGFPVTVNLTQSKIMFEPSAISVIGNHAVNSIRCQSAKPLITQTLEDGYTAVSAPVTGKVNFIGGDNCIINLQQSNNTVLISAVKNANGTEDEVCGIWKEKVEGAETKDVLCNEAVYSLGGAYPDDAGNIVITGTYPISVSSLTLDQLPDKFKNLATSFPHIDKFIYVGSPARALADTCPPADLHECS
jgi:hypothetical protein